MRFFFLLLGVGKEDLQTLATEFMKNRPATTSRYYVQIWAQREASRISMKCYGTFNITDALKSTKVPSPGKIKSWFNNQKEIVRKDFGTLVEDENLAKAIIQYGKILFLIYISCLDL